MDKYVEKIGMTKAAALETQAKNILDRRNSNLPDPEVGWYLCLRDGKDYCGCGLVHVKVKESLKGCEDPGHTNLWSFFFFLSTLIYLSQKAQMVCQVWQGHRDSCAVSHRTPSTSFQRPSFRPTQKTISAAASVKQGWSLFKAERCPGKAQNVTKAWCELRKDLKMFLDVFSL